MVDRVKLRADGAVEAAVYLKEVAGPEGDEEEVYGSAGDEEMRALPFSRAFQVESFDAFRSLHRSLVSKLDTHGEWKP